MTIDVTDVLRNAVRKGVRLWPENGQLRFKAPKGALSVADLELIRSCRTEILSILERSVRSASSSTNARLDSKPFEAGSAPLTFSQMAHWHLYHLDARASVCPVPLVIQLRGPLDHNALRKAFIALTHRHSALRTRIRMHDERPEQEILPASEASLQIESLSHIPLGHRDQYLERRIEAVLLEPVNVVADALLSARLFELGDAEHVLLVVMEHIICDGVSMSIAERELLDGYSRALRGLDPSWELTVVQFAEYARLQKAQHAQWLIQHRSYWDSRFAGCGRLRFPADMPATTASRRWGMVPVSIDGRLRKDLLDWCRLKKTTLVLVVLTAFISLVLRWCCKHEAIILYQTDGRSSPMLEGTIGYFAFPLYLRVDLRQSDSFVEVLHRIKEEYCNAYEHADYSYFESRQPRAEVTRNPRFNWLRQDPLTHQPTADQAGPLRSVRLPLSQSVEERLLQNIETDAEPVMGLLETDTTISGGIYFSASYHSHGSMERFAHNLQTFLKELLQRPDRPVTEIALV